MLRRLLAGMTTLGFVLCSACSFAQDDSGGSDAGSCLLRDHVYSCSNSAFRPLLMNARTIAVNVHNVDGVGRSQLSALLTGKLGKSLATDGVHPDLIFLLIPIEPSGVVYNSGDADLGTLRVYSVTADGGRGHLLWAETYHGPTDVPWPLVVRGLLLQFQSHFEIN